MAVSINELISLNASDSSFNHYPSLDLRYGPYDNVSAALTALTSSKRCIGLTVGIKKDNTIVEYWFKGGIQDSNLVEKSDSTYENYKINNGIKTKEEFFKTLSEIVDTSSYIVLDSNIDNVKVEVTVASNSPTIVGNSIVNNTIKTNSNMEEYALKSETCSIRIDTKNLDTNLPQKCRQINITTSKGAEPFILDDNILNFVFSSTEREITFTLPSDTYNNVIGFYNSDTGELLSNEDSYIYKTDLNLISLTLIFKNNGNNK